jgi:hypothetical protein
MSSLFGGLGGRRFVHCEAPRETVNGHEQIEFGTPAVIAPAREALDTKRLEDFVALRSSRECRPIGDGESPQRTVPSGSAFRQLSGAIKLAFLDHPLMRLGGAFDPVLEVIALRRQKLRDLIDAAAPTTGAGRRRRVID